MTCTVDTRFFLTHYLADTDQLKAKATRKMVELQREAAIVPTIALHEVYKFMHDHVGKDVAQLRVNSIMTSPFKIVDLTAKIAVTPANLRCRYRDLPIADSIVAATSETKSRRVLSDDSHFKKIREIQYEWF
ncbi:MAG: PIN domain-containing protein [Candidatus Bathyarchaeia archaeon]